MGSGKTSVAIELSKQTLIPFIDLDNLIEKNDSRYKQGNYSGAVKEIEKLYSHDKVVAIGEIGLDYYYKHSPKKIQQKIFNEQLELAKSLNAPVVIHNRLSDADLLNSLKVLLDQCLEPLNYNY